jgi:hypothetical protein
VDARRAGLGSCVSDAAAEPVKIDVANTGLHLSAAQRVRVVRRVLLALSRFGPRVHKVSVRVAALPGALGGLDQRCRMRAWLQAGDGIGVEVINGRIEAAVGRAATRLAARVTCVLDGHPGGVAHVFDCTWCRSDGQLLPRTPATLRHRPPVGARPRARAR